MNPFRSLALAAVVLTGCGYVGDPLPPALKIPVKIEDLAAVQRGDRIIIQFVAPEMTTDGIRLEQLGEIDLRIGPTVQPWHRPTWEGGAKRIELDKPSEPGLVRIEAPVNEWEGREVIIGVRVSNPKGRYSAWSNLVALNVVQPLATPSEFRSEPVPEGVRLSWQVDAPRPGLRFQVFRRQENSNTQAQLGETGEMEWVDTTARIGSTYSYQMIALAPAGGNVAQSELTEPLSITLKDIFPPTVPERLTAIVGLNTIELTWENSRDHSAVTYRIFRAAGDAETHVIAEDVRASSYSDADVISGQRYRYAVSALDESGNESAPSATVEQVAP